MASGNDGDLVVVSMPMRAASCVLGIGVIFAALGACGDHASPPAPPSSSAPLPSSVPSVASESVAPPPEKRSFDVREGQALVRSPTEAALYVADEDHQKLRRIALADALSKPPSLKLPLGDREIPPLADGPADEIDFDLPGRPAQVFALGDRVLVTIRDPGLLVIVAAGAAPREIARVALPADAWGLAVSADGASAFVASAWTHKVSKVDLAKNAVAWTVDVPREPRGLAVTRDGKKLYVSHLMGTDLTRIDTSGDAPKVDRIALPADPLHTLAGDKTVDASLGYSMTFSPDESRLFVAREALGALWAWQGNATVDVLVTASDEPLAPARGGQPYGTLTTEILHSMGSWDQSGAIAGMTSALLDQPRAMVYRKKTHQLLALGEGKDALVELDALAIAPASFPNRNYRLGGVSPEPITKVHLPPNCGAPSGVALSDDENVAWVYCRTTDDIVAVRLKPDGERAYSSETTFIADGEYKDKISPWGPFAIARLRVPPVPDDLALGRRLFFDGTDDVVSEGMACSGCHPDGRDDGHVWRERKGREFQTFTHFIAGPSLASQFLGPDEKVVYGSARQTPMLAGRVSALGPYGWQGESPTLVDRIKAGFELHRPGDHPTDGQSMRMRADPLARYVREGLVAPPKHEAPLTDEERHGKELFESPKTDCAHCHVPDKEFTDRSLVPLATKPPPLFEEDAKPAYKVPSLLWVGSTPPYYHDGSAPTLAFLIDHNGDHMGKTSHLDDAERRALVAYLETL